MIKEMQDRQVRWYPQVENTRTSCARSVVLEGIACLFQEDFVLEVRVRQDLQIC